jgi:medium-chain acyl-[acyl-carrier-protein] hydrolase
MDDPTTWSHAERWLSFRAPRRHAAARLLCFPHAGAGASVFRTWSRHVDPRIEVCPVQLPGREDRITERPFTRIQPLVQATADVLGPHLDLPFALFGHSFGAIVAFELARELRRRGAEPPAVLLVSGHRAPQLPLRRIFVADQPDEVVIARLRELNGTPQRLLDEPELLEQFLTVVRADFTVCDQYVYQPERPMQCPIVAFGGTRDHLLVAGDLEAWRMQTRSGFTLEWFVGDHFFPQTHAPIVAARISGHLLRLLLPG